MASAPLRTSVAEMQRMEAYLLRELEANPGSVATWRALTNVERTLGNLPREALALEHWRALEPENSAVWNRLAELHQARGAFDEAIEAFQRATTLAPHFVTAWEGLALALLGAQRLSRARAVRDLLLECFPDKAGSHLLNGHILRAEGAVEDAVRAYERALAIDPERCAALFNLVQLRTPAPREPLAFRAQQLREQAELDPADQANLDFALARIYEQAGEHDTAFHRYRRANESAALAMRARGITYDPAAFERHVTRTIRQYGARTFARTLAPAPLELQPIFIIGLPRSGTTLIEQILASHPLVRGGGELPTGPHLEHRFSEGRAAAGSTGEVDLARAADADLLLEMRERYFDALFERDLCGAFVTDKLPGNFLVAGFLRLLFPQAAIVHVTRDPVATCWSLYTANFGIHSPYYNSLEHLAHYTLEYRRLMQHWRAVLTPGIIEVRYESLVARAESETRRLLAALGLPWDARCLTFHENPRAVLTASHSEVRKPLYREALQKWRHYARHLQALEPLRER